MKKLIYRAVVLFFAVGMFFVLGCEDEEEVPPAKPEVRSLEIVFLDDSLVFLPGDSAALLNPLFAVIARGEDGLVIAVKHIIITLANPELGDIVYLDSLRQDTTNEQGTVICRFISNGQSGDNMIIATADGITATRPFFAYGGGGGPQWHVYMLIDNNSLTMYPLDTVSTTFSVLVTNEYHGNEPGVKVNLTLANPLLGYIEFTDPLRRDTTDMFGQVHGVYHTWAAGCNNVVAEVEGFSDAAEVCTQPLEIGSVEVYIYEPYLIFDEGDSSEAQVVAYVWAPDNRFLSGVRVQMSVTDQQWGVLLPFSSGQSDRTDSEGRIRMMYSTFAEGCNHIIFQAGGLSDSVEICSYERLYAVGEIVVENPDLRHFPGDSVETAVTIFMRDRQNAPLPDIELEIELHSLSGLIEYVNPEQGNVTDAAGRVDLRVRSAADECGYISANYMEGWVDGREICVYEYNPEIRLYTIPGEIHFPEEDSVMLRLELTDDDFGAYQDSVLSVWISGGELAHNPLPPTNIEGGSSTWWRFNGASGYFQAAVNFYGFTDTTTIYVP